MAPRVPVTLTHLLFFPKYFFLAAIFALYPAWFSGDGLFGGNKVAEYGFAWGWQYRLHFYENFPSQNTQHRNGDYSTQALPPLPGSLFFWWKHMPGKKQGGL